MMTPPFRALLIAPLLLLVGACTRAHPRVAMEPTTELRAPDERALAVYRVVADSIYVRTTARPIAVVTTSMDTACTSLPCEGLADRWGVGSLWWSHTDAEEAATARANLLAKSAMRFDLRPVVTGTRNLVSIDPARVPVPGADVEPWIAFRDGNSAAAGALHFSPVGFGKSGHTAIVYVDWRCGPSCGHALSVSLTAISDSTWRIDDMLLLSSLQH
jgi:hypothetical protein